MEIERKGEEELSLWIMLKKIKSFNYIWYQNYLVFKPFLKEMYYMNKNKNIFCDCVFFPYFFLLYWVLFRKKADLHNAWFYENSFYLECIGEDNGYWFL